MTFATLATFCPYVATRAILTNGATIASTHAFVATNLRATGNWAHAQKTSAPPVTRARLATRHASRECGAPIAMGRVASASTLPRAIVSMASVSSVDSVISHRCVLTSVRVQRLASIASRRVTAFAISNVTRSMDNARRGLVARKMAVRRAGWVNRARFCVRLACMGSTVSSSAASVLIVKTVTWLVDYSAEAVNQICRDFLLVLVIIQCN